MANLKEWIKEEAEGEKIEGVVIGEMGWGDYGKEDVPNYDNIPKGKVLSWKEAQKFLDYEFHDGYGAPGCNSIYVWTSSYVLFIVQYDGSTEIEKIPRNPIDIMPYMPGG
jgi:hypothetical protein